MSFQPFVLGTGLPGWNLLNATLEMQKSAFNQSRPTLSDSNYFLERFADINSPDDIVSDRRLMRVVLGAYGLSDDIENRYFIKTVMAEGVADPEALANRLADRRYRALAADFDFSGLSPTHKADPGLSSRTVENFRNQTFEIEIGKADNDMRLALGFSRELSTVWRAASSNSAAWYQILATPPLREVLQTSLGLPSEFVRLDIDDQHSRIQAKAQSVFGTNDTGELAGAALANQITQRFLLIRQAGSMSGRTSLQTALVLLNAIQMRDDFLN